MLYHERAPLSALGRHCARTLDGYAFHMYAFLIVSAQGSMQAVCETHHFRRASAEAGMTGGRALGSVSWR
jgi:hypothetical protein